MFVKSAVKLFKLLVFQTLSVIFLFLQSSDFSIRSNVSLILSFVERNLQN